VPVVLGGFLHVGKMGIRRQPADSLGVEQTGPDLGKNLVLLPALACLPRVLPSLTTFARVVKKVGRTEKSWWETRLRDLRFGLFGLVQKPRFLGNSTDPERGCLGG
jgi:hypothetical protein